MESYDSVSDVYRVWPIGKSAAVTQADLVELYRWPATTVTVRANMVSSIDGAALGPDGLSGSLNNAADKLVFDTLRGLCDVVLVAAGTVRDEGYISVDVPDAWRHERERVGCKPEIEFAIVTASGHLPQEVLNGGGTGRLPLIFTTSTGRDALNGRITDKNIVVVGHEDVDPSRVIDALAHRGLRRILTEGGPSFLSRLVREGLVDELCLTTSGVLSPGSHRTVTDDGQEHTLLARCTLAHQLICPDPMTTLALWRVDVEGVTPDRLEP